MELYKIIALVLIMNIGLSMAATFSEPDKNWTDWASQPGSVRLIRYIRDMVQEQSDPENMRVQQNAEQLEYSGGVSKFMLITIPLGIIENVLLGGLETSIGLVWNSWSEGAMINVIAWACLMFISTMYIWIGLKLYSWAFNKDSQ